MLVISDTSPIRALAWVRLLHVLESLYGKVVIPPAVVRELQCPDASFDPVDISQFPFIEVLAPADRLAVDRLRRHLVPARQKPWH